MHSIVSSEVEMLKKNIIQDLRALRCVATPFRSIKFNKRLNGVELILMVNDDYITAKLEYKIGGTVYPCKIIDFHHSVNKSISFPQGTERWQEHLEELITQFKFVYDIGGFSTYFGKKEEAVK